MLRTRIQSNANVEAGYIFRCHWTWTTPGGGARTEIWGRVEGFQIRFDSTVRRWSAC